MSTFNAGAIEAKLTLGRSDWTKDLKKTKKEIEDLEKVSVTIGIELGDSDIGAELDRLKEQLENFSRDEYSPSLGLGSSQLVEQLRKSQNLLTHFAEQTYRADLALNTEQVRAELNETVARLKAIEDESISIGVKVNATSANRVLLNLERRLRNIDNTVAIPAVLADTAEAVASLRLLEAELTQMEYRKVNIEVETDVLTALDDLGAIELLTDEIDGRTINLDVDVNDFASTTAQLEALEAEVSALDGRDVDIKVDVNQSALDKLVGESDGGGGGGSFGLLKVLMVAIIALAPVLSVAIGASAAAIVGLAGALSGAVGAAGLLAGGLALLVLNGQDLAGFSVVSDALDGVKDALDALTPLIADSGFDLMADSLDALSKIVPTLEGPFNDIADAVDGVVQEFSNWVGSSEYNEMLDFFGGFGADMLVSFLHILGNLARFFGRLFSAMEPFIRDMMGGLEDLTESWADWADGLESNTAFQDWMANAAEYGPRVLDMLGSFLDALLGIGEALVPFAGPLLDGLTWLFDMIADAPTGVLTVLIGLFSALYLGITVLAPMVTGLVSAFTLLAPILAAISLPMILIAALVAGLAATIIYLWKTNDDFRQGIIDTWNQIVQTVGPIIADLVDLFKTHWDDIKKYFADTFVIIQGIVIDAFDAIETLIRVALGIIHFIWENFGDGIMSYMTSMFEALGNIVQGGLKVIQGVVKVITGLIHNDWSEFGEGLKLIFSGMLQVIKGMLQAWLAPFKAVWVEIKGSVLGVWDDIRTGIGNKIDAAFSDVKTKWNDFKSWWDKLTPDFGKIWGTLGSGFSGVMNSIIGWWNDLSFGFDDIVLDPPGPGPKVTIPGVHVGTPDIPKFADGGYVTEATLAMVGEGREPEIISPESKMQEIVSRYSGPDIDYGRLAAAVAGALASVLGQMKGVTPEDLERLIEAASVNINVEGTATPEQQSLAELIGYQMRLLGYGGRMAGV